MGIASDTDHDARAAQDDVPATDAFAGLDSPSLAIVGAVADATDEDPAAMTPLYDVVDPDALDTLLATDAPIEIIFEYEGHAIEVTGDGEVLVDGQAAAGDSL